MKTFHMEALFFRLYLVRPKLLVNRHSTHRVSLEVYHQKTVRLVDRTFG